VASTSFLRKPLPYRNFNAAFLIIAANMAVFLLAEIAPQVLRYLAMNPFDVVARGYVWQIFTYMFAHSGIWHVVMNMLIVFIIGTHVETRLGSYEFLLFYGLVGVLAGAFSLGWYLITGNLGVYLLGASGAAFGLLLAFATLFPDAEVYVFGILPVTAPFLVIGLTFLSFFSRGNIAHFTHLAGFLFAFFYLLIRLGINPIRVFRDELHF